MKARCAPAALLLATAGCADSDETSAPAGTAALTVAAGFERTVNNIVVKVERCSTRPLSLPAS